VQRTSRPAAAGSFERGKVYRRPRPRQSCRKRGLLSPRSYSTLVLRLWPPLGVINVLTVRAAVTAKEVGNSRAVWRWCDGDRFPRSPSCRAGRGPLRITARRVSPATSSLAMYNPPSCSPMSYLATMSGWLRAAAARASCSKRTRLSGRSSSKQFVTATARASPECESVAQRAETAHD